MTKKLPKRKISITIEDDFGRVHTAIITNLSPSMVMNKILEVLE